MDKKVTINIQLTHPHDSRIRFSPCETSREAMIRELGIVNYDFAVQQGWITEAQEEACPCCDPDLQSVEV